MQKDVAPKRKIASEPSDAELLAGFEPPAEKSDEELLAGFQAPDQPTGEPTTSTAEALLTGIGRGGTLGYLPQVQAGVHAGLSKILPESMGGAAPGTPIGDIYSEAEKSFTQQAKIQEEEHPMATLGGELVGGMAVPFGAVAKGAKALGGLVRSAKAVEAMGDAEKIKSAYEAMAKSEKIGEKAWSITKEALAAGGAGAVEGAVYGALSGDPTTTESMATADRLERGMWGAGIGGALGTGLTLGSRLFKGVTKEAEEYYALRVNEINDLMATGGKTAVVEDLKTSAARLKEDYESGLKTYKQVKSEFDTDLDIAKRTIGLGDMQVDKDFSEASAIFKKKVSEIPIEKDFQAKIETSLKQLKEDAIDEAQAAIEYLAEKVGNRDVLLMAEDGSNIISKAVQKRIDELLDSGGIPLAGTENTIKALRDLEKEWLIGGVVPKIQMNIRDIKKQMKVYDRAIDFDPSVDLDRNMLNETRKEIRDELKTLLLMQDPSGEYAAIMNGAHEKFQLLSKGLEYFGTEPKITSLLNHFDKPARRKQQETLMKVLEMARTPESLRPDFEDFLNTKRALDDLKEGKLVDLPIVEFKNYQEAKAAAEEARKARMESDEARALKDAVMMNRQKELADMVAKNESTKKAMDLLGGEFLSDPANKAQGIFDKMKLPKLQRDAIEEEINVMAKSLGDKELVQMIKDVNAMEHFDPTVRHLLQSAHGDKRDAAAIAFTAMRTIGVGAAGYNLMSVMSPAWSLAGMAGSVLASNWGPKLTQKFIQEAASKRLFTGAISSSKIMGMALPKEMKLELMSGFRRSILGSTFQGWKPDYAAHQALDPITVPEESIPEVYKEIQNDPYMSDTAKASALNGLNSSGQIPNPEDYLFSADPEYQKMILEEME